MNADLRRAARLSLIPGRSAAELARETGLPVAAIRRARKDPALALSRDDLVLAALTDNGKRTKGAFDPASIASWVDYVNHDGSNADGVRGDLERLAAKGILELTSESFRLLIAWP